MPTGSHSVIHHLSKINSFRSSPLVLKCSGAIQKIYRRLGIFLLQLCFPCHFKRVHFRNLGPNVDVFGAPPSSTAPSPRRRGQLLPSFRGRKSSRGCSGGGLKRLRAVGLKIEMLSGQLATHNAPKMAQRLSLKSKSSLDWYIIAINTYHD